MNELTCDILIVGAGTGGTAAALSACDLGYRVIMTEPTSWVGGQLSSQAVPPDEHRHIETQGATARYRQFRADVREYYRLHRRLTHAAMTNPLLNPGEGWVSRLCHEPAVAHQVLMESLQPHLTRGNLQIFYGYEPISAEMDGDTITAVSFRSIADGDPLVIQAQYVLDATELGDLLPITGAEYVTGAESQSQTGEPHAPTGEPQPGQVQSFTWCALLGYDPHKPHPIEKPASYEHWRDIVPPGWRNGLLDWTTYNHLGEAQEWTLLDDGPEGFYGSFFTYRRIVCQQHYLVDHQPQEVTVVNWPQNDYVFGNIIDQPEEVVQQHLQASKELTLSLVYWLQNEAPRPDGGIGWPGVQLRPDLSGTQDGLAMAPYHRESRRIQAEYTVLEQHVSASGREGAAVSPAFWDSVGVGSYTIDIHNGAGGAAAFSIPTLPFTIPLGALIPVRMRNLIPACKNIGVTHITNGCYRLHPVEWNIGESAGLLAAFCLSKGCRPSDVRAGEGLFGAFRRLLHAQGVQTAWEI
ncbi:MAG: FAD-dependent oxidoreductase [Armatimonadota bacterium]